MPIRHDSQSDQTDVTATSSVGAATPTVGASSPAARRYADVTTNPFAANGQALVPGAPPPPASTNPFLSPASGHAAPPVADTNPFRAAATPPARASDGAGSHPGTAASAPTDADAPVFAEFDAFLAQPAPPQTASSPHSAASAAAAGDAMAHGVVALDDSDSEADDVGTAYPGAGAADATRQAKRRFKQIIHGAYGEAVAEDKRTAPKASRKQRAKKFGAAVRGGFATGVSDDTKSHGTYSQTGRSQQTHRKAADIADTVIGNVSRATTLTGAAGVAHDAKMGPVRRAGKTRSKASVVEERAGQVLEGAGNVAGMFPVVGAAGAVLSGPGAGLQAHAQGRNRKESAAVTGRETVVGGLQGLIPGYGSYAGGVGALESGRKLMSPIEQHGSAQYIAGLHARIAALEELKEEPTTPPALMARIDRAVDKIEGMIAKEQRRRQRSERGEMGVKRGLLGDRGDFRGGNNDDSDDDMGAGAAAPSSDTIAEAGTEGT